MKLNKLVALQLNCTIVKVDWLHIILTMQCSGILWPNHQLVEGVIACILTQNSSVVLSGRI